MNYNIILEGCDCVGKTTLGNALAARLGNGIKRAHIVAPKNKEDAKTEYSSWVVKLNHETGWILDRGMLGECVYAPIMRNYYPEYMREFEYNIDAHNVLVLVTAEPAVVQARFDGVFIKKEDIPLVLHRFWAEWADSNYEVKIVADTTNQSAEELAERIIKICNQRFSID